MRSIILRILKTDGIEEVIGIIFSGVILGLVVTFVKLTAGM